MRSVLGGVLLWIAVASPVAAGPAIAGPIPEDAARVLFFLERQRDDLGAFVLEVSDPASRSYGRYRSVETIAARYGASAEVIERVESFLASHGIESSVDVTGTFISALLDPTEVEAVFGEDPPVYPPVPAEIADVVTGIVGTFSSVATSALPLSGPLRVAGLAASVDAWPDWSKISGTPAPCPDFSDPDHCSNAFANPGPASAFRSFTPDQLRTAYGIEPTGLTGRGRTAVVVELGQRVDPSDIDAYTDGLGLPRVPLHQIVLDERSPPLADGFEATLDVETLAAMAPGLERLTLIAAHWRTHADFVTHWNMLFSQALDTGSTGGTLPDVVSSSWFLACEHDLPPTFLVDANEAILQTAGAVGVTVANAAGDQGSTSCVPRTPPYDQTFLSLEYPASSAWVTAVGATNIVLTSDNAIDEVQAWNDWPLQLDRPLKGLDCHTPPCRPQPVWAGGGGRSILFDRPPWQKGRGVDLAGKRQVPDLAFLGDIYPGTLLHFQGRWIGEGNGTSQATPIFSAMILMLNEAAASAGRPRIGFASPLVYQLARKASHTFVDVVVGDNVVGDNEHRFDVDCCFAGPGYDLTSGWGSLLLDRAVAAMPLRNVAVAPRSRLPVADPR